MSMDRRNFLKLAGFSTIAGLGSLTGYELIKPGQIEASSGHGDDAPTTKQLAMVIDVNKLSSEAEYEKIISACHKVHNVPDHGNPKDEVKWIWTEDFAHSFPGQEHEFVAEEVKNKTFLLLCNHCSNPPCTRVCPTKATFKRKSDGAVVVDFHRCIGCRFCMAACPYGARSFNWKDPRLADNLRDVKDRNKDFPTRTIGVVEKCNFCVERLAEGLEPACVEAAKPTGALVWGDINDAESPVREILRHNFALRRKPELGTGPNVYFVIGPMGGNHDA